MDPTDRIVRSAPLVAALLALACHNTPAPVALTVSCLTRPEQAPPPPPPPPPACDCATRAPAPTPPVRPTGPVARWGAAWQRAEVIGAVCPGFVRVRFEPDAHDESEVVSVRDVQETDAQGRLPEVHALPPGAPVVLARLRVGSEVQARYNGQWYPATVRVLRRDGTVGIRYDGYGAEWDENMALDALCLRSGEAFTHPTGAPGPHGTPLAEGVAVTAGTRVEARSRGRWYDARVIGEECGGLVRVHFAGWEPVWDAVIARDRLRRGGATATGSD